MNHSGGTLPLLDFSRADNMFRLRFSQIVVVLFLLAVALEARQAPPAARPATPTSTVRADATIREIMVFASAGDLDAACENCHLTFWYPDQEKLFKK